MVRYTEAVMSRQVSTMSDENLIQAFVDGFLQGQTILLSNQQLRTEPLFDSMQLLSGKEGVIATAKLHATPMAMIVRHNSSYWEMMHQSLAQHDFHPLSPTSPKGSYLYRYCETPEGYNLQCTTAKELWRAVWGRGFGLRSGIPLDLLVWRKGPAGSKETWYSLRGMDCDNGQLAIKLLGWTDPVAGTDLVVWARQDLSRNANQSATNPQSKVRPDLRAHLPFRQ